MIAGLIVIMLVLVCLALRLAMVLKQDYQDPSKTVAWLVVLYLFPILGMIMYLYLAGGYRNRRTLKLMRPWARSGAQDGVSSGGGPSGEAGSGDRAEARGEAGTSDMAGAVDGAGTSDGTEPGVGAEGAGQGFLQLPEAMARETRLCRLLGAMPESRLTKRNRLELYPETDAAFQAMLEAIEQASSSIHLEFYTIRSDGIGWRFHQALAKKASEGVRVRVIYDGVGSHQLAKNYLRDWQAAGVEAHCFLPPLIAFFDKRINYRNHRKLMVVDGREAFLGGMNIGDEYLGGNPKLGYWKDLFLRVQGDAAEDIQMTFLEDWARVSGDAGGRRHAAELEELFPPHEVGEGAWTQVIKGGPDRTGAGIYELILGALAAAKERIWISTPYFIPDQALLAMMRNAAASGVDVRILIPDKPDNKVVYAATLSYVEQMLRVGVRFYRYHKGFLHAKALLMDHALASVGTANLDMRSLFSNFEINAVFYDGASVASVEHIMREMLADCTAIEPAELTRKTSWQRAKEQACRVLSPLL